MTYLKTILRGGCICLSILLLSTCIKSPVSDEGGEIAADGRTVTGKVALSDGTNPGGVYVWLEGFEIGTFTNSEGNFALTIPPPQTQPGGGLNGTFDLFFYVGDYTYQRTTVNLLNGEFLPGQGGLDNNGRVRETIELEKMVEISVTRIGGKRMSNTVWPRNYSVTLEISLKIATVGGALANVVSFGTGAFGTAGFVRQIEDPDIQIPLVFGSMSSRTIRGEMTFQSDSLVLGRCILPIGEYEFIPFVWVRQTGVPSELFRSLGVNFESFSLNFLNIPFKHRQSGKFGIRQENDGTEMFPFPRC